METPLSNPDWARLQLGQDHDDLVIDSSEDNRQLSALMASQASQQLDIFSRDLDARVYDDTDFVEAVRQLAVQNDRAQIRILVIDPDHATRHGHRLIELARRLTSRMEIRRVHTDYAAFVECYFLADKRGVIHRKLASRYEAIVNFNLPPRAAELTAHFHEIWERSQPEANFKRLYI